MNFAGIGFEYVAASGLFVVGIVYSFHSQVLPDDFRIVFARDRIRLKLAPLLIIVQWLIMSVALGFGAAYFQTNTAVSLMSIASSVGGVMIGDRLLVALRCWSAKLGEDAFQRVAKERGL